MSTNPDDVTVEKMEVDGKQVILVRAKSPPPAMPSSLAKLAAMSMASMASLAGPMPMLSSGDSGPYKGLSYPPEPLYAAGRNDLCPCGSGRKFKRCCIRETKKRRPADGEAKEG